MIFVEEQRSKKQFDLDQCRDLFAQQEVQPSFFGLGAKDEKADVDSKRCSDIEKACGQKDASGKHRPKVEENRGSDPAKGF
jgi:hypothetical protein